MPTVLRVGPYRFYFHSHEPGEPPHVHVDRDAQSAKFWLKPVALARSIRFSPTEIRALKAIVDQQENVFLEAWHEYFGK